MKSLIRSFLFNAASLWLVGQLVSGIYFAKGYETLLLTAAVLGLVNLFVKPLINILLLPINLLTLGTLRWLVNVATLYLVTLLVSDFKIIGFSFSGFAYNGFSIPAFSTTGFLALVLTSFILSLCSSFLFWLAK
ncbi:MAG: phage holin family protein [Patescibacteria group bacterium]